MRVAIISDTHSDVESLEQALTDIADKNVDQIWHLGDIVGYRSGTADQTLTLVRENCDVVIAGNHDLAAVGQLNWFLDVIPAFMRSALTDVQKETSAENFEFLSNLNPEAYPNNNVSLYHAHVTEPVMEFLNRDNARDQLLLQPSYLSLVGHTHSPVAVSLKGNIINYQEKNHGDVVDLKTADKWVLNPGALGVKQFNTTDQRKGWMLLEGDKDFFDRAEWFRIDS